MRPTRDFQEGLDGADPSLVPVNLSQRVEGFVDHLEAFPSGGVWPRCRAAVDLDLISLSHHTRTALVLLRGKSVKFLSAMNAGPNP